MSPPDTPSSDSVSSPDPGQNQHQLYNKNGTRMGYLTNRHVSDRHYPGRRAKGRDGRQWSWFGNSKALERKVFLSFASPWGGSTSLGVALGSRSRESDATYPLVSWIRRFWRVASIATFRIKYRHPVHPCSIEGAMEWPLGSTVSLLPFSLFISLFSLGGLLQHCSSVSKTVA